MYKGRFQQKQNKTKTFSFFTLLITNKSIEKSVVYDMNCDLNDESSGRLFCPVYLAHTFLPRQNAFFWPRNFCPDK